MSLLRRSTRAAGDVSREILPGRRPIRGTGSVTVTSDSALMQSAVWACLSLRANVVSSTPLDVFRRVNGRQVESPKPALFDLPGGEHVGMPEWLFSTQFEIDRSGNAFGLVTKLDGAGWPAEIELQPTSEVTVIGKGPQVTGYRIGRKTYDPRDKQGRLQVWHEKGVTIPGVPIGLAPLYYAAASIGGYLSAQQVALDLFAAGPHPKGTLRNLTQDMVGSAAIDEAKARFKAATAQGDIFVHGKNWEYTPETQSAVTGVYLSELAWGTTDVCRFLGVPSDMVDAAQPGSSITYANVSQRNLQFLILHIGPAFNRREWALSRYAMPTPRYAKFQTDALLRMDPASRVELLLQQVAGKTLTPTEARDIDNRAPFTEDDIAEIERIFGAANRAPAPAATVKEQAP